MTKLVPLTPATSPAANSIRITCGQCGRQQQYDKAVTDGWTFDPQGRAFVDYYCPECTTEVTKS